MDPSYTKTIDAGGNEIYTVNSADSEDSKLVIDWLYNNNDHVPDEFNLKRVAILKHWLADNHIDLPWPVFLNADESQTDVKRFLEHTKTIKNVVL